MRLQLFFLALVPLFPILWIGCGKPRNIPKPSCVQIVKEDQIQGQMEIKVAGLIGTSQSHFIDWINSEGDKLTRIEMMECEAYEKGNKRLRPFRQLLKIEVENGPGWVGGFVANGGNLEEVTIAGGSLCFESNGLYSDDIQKLRNAKGLKKLSLISFNGQHQEMAFENFESIKSLPTKSLTLSATSV